MNRASKTCLIYLFAIHGICFGSTNNILDILLPTNVCLTLESESLLAERTNAFKPPINNQLTSLTTNENEELVVERLYTQETVATYWYYFFDNNLDAIKGSKSFKYPPTQSEFNEALTNSNFHFTQEYMFLKWNGECSTGTNILSFSMEQWGNTNSMMGVGYCFVSSNQVDFVIFNSDFLSITNFYVTTNRITELTNVLNCF